MKIIVLNISQATGSVFSGNLSVLDVICSKTHEMAVAVAVDSVTIGNKVSCL